VRRATALALAAVGGTAEAAPATVRGAYTTGVTLPDPTTSGAPYETCEGLPTSRHRRAVVLPGPGRLTVSLSSVGDWGLALRDARGRALGRTDAVLLGGTERLALRVRARTRVLVDACNFAGAPTARVSWVFARSSA
jgi:hypothetical protein